MVLARQRHPEKPSHHCGGFFVSTENQSEDFNPATLGRSISLSAGKASSIHAMALDFNVTIFCGVKFVPLP
jgi:hypothetical protein